MSDDIELNEFVDLDEVLCDQVRDRIHTNGFPNVVVGTFLQTDPFPQNGQIWMTLTSGTTLEAGEIQDIDYLVRVFAPTEDMAKSITRRLRAIMDIPQALWYSGDDGAPNLPIYLSVSGTFTSPPAPTTLFLQEGQSGYFFTLTLTQVTLPTTDTTGENLS